MSKVRVVSIIGMLLTSYYLGITISGMNADPWFVKILDTLMILLYLGGFLGWGKCFINDEWPWD